MRSSRQLTRSNVTSVTAITHRSGSASAHTILPPLQRLRTAAGRRVRTHSQPPVVRTITTLVCQKKTTESHLSDSLLSEHSATCHLKKLKERERRCRCTHIPQNTEIRWHYGETYAPLRDYNTGGPCRVIVRDLHPPDVLGHLLPYDAVSPMLDSPSNSSSSDDPEYTSARKPLRGGGAKKLDAAQFQVVHAGAWERVAVEAHLEPAR
jgi:hypothetical protein